jgi:hypothetical protein
MDTSTLNKKQFLPSHLCRLKAVWKGKQYMKKIVLAVTLLALAGSQVQNARAGDREWAVVGKVLTGIAAVDIIGHAIADRPAYYAPAPVAYYPPPVTYCPPPVVYRPAPVVVYQQPVCFQPAPAVVYRRPVVVRHEPIVSIGFGYGFDHHDHGYAYGRR